VAEHSNKALREAIRSAIADVRFGGFDVTRVEMQPEAVTGRP
jgi:ribosome-binding factor A